MPTFTELAQAKGLDLRKEVRNLNRRLRYAWTAPNLNRIVPGVPGGGNYGHQEAEEDAKQITEAADPLKEYIRLFETRNHLVRS